MLGWPESKEDFRGRNAFSIAAAHGHVQVLSVLHDHAPALLGARDKLGATPLHAAAEAGWVRGLQRGFNNPGKRSTRLMGTVFGES